MGGLTVLQEGCIVRQKLDELPNFRARRLTEDDRALSVARGDRHAFIPNADAYVRVGLFGSVALLNQDRPRSVCSTEGHRADSARERNTKKNSADQSLHAPIVRQGPGAAISEKRKAQAHPVEGLVRRATPRPSGSPSAANRKRGKFTLSS